MPAQGSSSTSLTEAAYQALRADILACRISPGEKLKMNEMCNALGVSLGAVREALSRLSAEGLVVSEAQKGFRAAPVSVEDLEDLNGTRVEIETLCLRRAVERGDVEWEIGIVSAFHRLSRIRERVSGDELRISEEWAAAHREFHAALVQACDSRWRLQIRDQLYAQSERYRRLSVPAAPQERDLEEEHRAIMEAALARNAEKAALLMTKHLKRTATLVKTLSVRFDERSSKSATKVAHASSRMREDVRTPRIGRVGREAHR
jgi:DNA-binding GntR family transcriptional regulator